MNANQTKVTNYLALLNEGRISQRELFILSVDILTELTDAFTFDEMYNELEMMCMADRNEHPYYFSANSERSIVAFLSNNY